MISLRLPAGRACMREVRALSPASRKSSGEGAGHGLTHRVPSPVSYARYLAGLRRLYDARPSAPAAHLRTPQRRA